jgi:hypothetical protein
VAHDYSFNLLAFNRAVNSGRSSATNEMQHERNNRKDKKNVDECPRNVKHQQTHLSTQSEAEQTKSGTHS